MSDVNTLLPLADPSQAAAAHDEGPHYQLIKKKTPDWLANADLERVYPLNDLVLHRPDWHVNASLQQQASLKALNGQAWAAQNKVDQKLRHVQDVYAFAEPLLKRAIKDQYGLDLDVKNTYLHIYTPKKLPWYALALSNGVTSRDVSLLDAALHNFAHHEKFERYSCYITRPDYRGHFNILRLERTMSLEQFKQLCRGLDLGARYQRHLNESLLPSEPVAQAYLQIHVIASQKAALKAAAQVALMKNDLDRSGHAVVMGVLDGTEKRATLYQLSMLDTPLTGILLISSDLEQASSIAKVIAYIPHDPVNPLKQYSSTTEFAQDLSRRLQLNAPLASSKHVPQHTYQQFFSQFVPHSRRGLFFATLAERLYQVQWHERDPLDPAPAWCEDPVSQPLLQYDVTRIAGDLWQQLYQASFNKIFNDARSLAVSTAQADDNERRNWWDNALKIASSLLNMALLVVTPFVPLLGELMLAYTLYQLTDDVMEGIVELSEGQADEAAQHVISVVTDVLQLAVIGTGGVLAKEVLFKPSSFVDSLKAVTVDGEPRLWNPDLTPYARKDLSLPEGSQPDALGLHEHQGQKVLRIDDRHWVVEHDPQDNTHRIRHPTRPRAYAPTIESNGSGAWVHEGEDPWEWGETQLRNRLGHVTQELSADQLEEACTTSATDESALRQMYLKLAPTPPLLADTLKRMTLFREAQALPEKVRTGSPVDSQFNWSAHLASELENWPSEKAIQVFDDPGLTGDPMVYGSSADDAHTLKLSHQELNAGKLPERLATFLTESELQAILPPPLPETPAARASALRNQLADKVAHEKVAIFNHLYSTREVLETAPAQLLRQQFPQLPAELAQRLMLRTSPDEVRIMTEEKKIPLRLNNLARELENETIASRAYEGFYNHDLITPDTERMVLNLLRQQRDTLGDLNISIYHDTPNGRLRSQAGPMDAGTKKILLRKNNARYELYDRQRLAPAAQYDLFEALLRTLPADSIEYVPGQGRLFKLWLMERLQPPAERRTALEGPSLRKPDQRVTQQLLQKPMLGAFRRWFGPTQPPTLQERVGKLFPRMPEEQASMFVHSLSALENGRQILEALEAEKRNLREDLDRWKRKPTFGPRYSVAALNETLMRDRIIDELVACWEARSNGEITPQGVHPHGTLLDLSELTLGRYTRTFGILRANFNHVTTLIASGTRLGSEDLGFLENFTHLRAVDLSDNNFDRVPRHLATLPGLTRLDLSNNPIRWDMTDFERLYQCSRLESLNLQNHSRLLMAPDIRRLPYLKQLVLRKTGVSQWPEGIDQPRQRPLELDLLQTAVNKVPQLPEGSPAIQVIAHSWLDRASLTNADEARFVEYRRASGIDPFRTVPAGDPQDSLFWMQGIKPDLLPDAREVWNTLENEHGSQGFFSMLRMLRPPEVIQDPADIQRFRQGRDDLIDRVWDVLIAIDRDPQLRKRLFTEASVFDNCVDAGTHTFNKMGMETLLANILDDTTPLGWETRESKLVKLAWQRWRLQKVNEVAKHDIIHRTKPVSQGGLSLPYGSGTNKVDEVEVYLAYQTGLKTRLDLPWLSEHMAYRLTANVTPAQLEAAYNTVIKAQENDGLINGILEQDFWRNYLEDTYASQYEARRSESAVAATELLSLIEEQEEWTAKDTAPERKAALHRQITQRINLFKRMEVDIPANIILVDQPLSEEAISHLWEELARFDKALSRRLTRRAMQGAGL